jgi:hypothetical protein
VAVSVAYKRLEALTSAGIKDERSFEMSDRFLSSVVVLLAVLTLSSAALAQTTATQSAESKSTVFTGTHHEGSVPHHDISGVWMISPGGNSSTSFHEPPSSFLQPWALAKLNAEPIALRKDLPEAHAGTGSALGKDANISCSQISLTEFITKQKPIEIVQTPQRIFMFFEYEHTYREIWIDGRELPKDPDPSYLGYSVGRWDGDTLVVDSVGFSDKTVLNGMPHSDALHFVERYRRPNLDTLELSMTADDSKAYTKPWIVGPVDLVWHPDWNLVEAFCLQENNDAFKEAVMKPANSEGTAPHARGTGKAGNKDDK